MLDNKLFDHFRRSSEPRPHVVVQEVERFLPIHTLLLQQPLIGGQELLQQLECFLLLEKDEGSSISAAVSDSRADRRRHNMHQGLFSR